MNVQFRPVAGFLSHPAGIWVLAFAEHMVVEVAGTRLFEVAMHRPDNLALMDEVIIRATTPAGPQETTTTPAMAKQYLEGLAINTPNGGSLRIGTVAVEAFNQHVSAWRAARAKSSGLVLGVAG